MLPIKQPLHTSAGTTCKRRSSGRKCGAPAIFARTAASRKSGKGTASPALHRRWTEQVSSYVASPVSQTASKTEGPGRVTFSEIGISQWFSTSGVAPTVPSRVFISGVPVNGCYLQRRGSTIEVIISFLRLVKLRPENEDQPYEGKRHFISDKKRNLGYTENP